MGITQHTNGTANAHALLNLSLVTGQLGLPGERASRRCAARTTSRAAATPAASRRTCPATSATTPATLAKFERAWGVRPPAEPGLVVTEMVEGCLTGAIRAMYVVGENPLLSEPDLHHAQKAIAQLDCLVVQDLFMHETAELAHVFLPAAGFAEKEGTFTNSERRVQRVRAGPRPAGRGAAGLVDHLRAGPARRAAARARRAASFEYGTPPRSSTRWRG